VWRYARTTRAQYAAYQGNELKASSLFELTTAAQPRMRTKRWMISAVALRQQLIIWFCVGTHGLRVRLCLPIRSANIIVLKFSLVIPSFSTSQT
jgi:hypothetical protein